MNNSEPRVEEAEDSYSIPEEEKQKRIQNYISKIIKLLDPAASREGMIKTPKRYSEAIMEMTRGNSVNIEKLINKAVFDSQGFNDIVVVKNMKYNSLCEHHLLPFYGEISVGYIPKGKILGLSKFPRIVDAMSKKFTLQEKLTMEIAEIINKHIEPQGVVVVANGSHSCMSFRGIKAIDSKTNTIYTLGAFKNSETLDRFYKLLDQ